MITPEIMIRSVRASLMISRLLLCFSGFRITTTQFTLKSNRFACMHSNGSRDTRRDQAKTNLDDNKIVFLARAHTAAFVESD